jgi:hypothetical protein
MGGFSVQCDCGKWFLDAKAYQDHCRTTNHPHYPSRVGARDSVPAEDVFYWTLLGTQARAIRLEATKLETAARQWATDRAVSPHELTRVQRRLGAIRHSLDELFKHLGKADL